jgi:hypothetical protein
MDEKGIDTNRFEKKNTSTLHGTPVCCTSRTSASKKPFVCLPFLSSTARITPSSSMGKMVTRIED